MADVVPPHMAEGVRFRALFKCEWCTLLNRPSPSGTHIHHRLTRGRGGPHDVHNMVNLCVAHHNEAHADNVWPWLIFGAITRGVYRGPDPAYQAAYPFQGELDNDRFDALVAAYGNADRAFVEWHVYRTRDYLALDAPRGLQHHHRGV